MDNPKSLLFYIIYFDKTLKIILNTGKDSALYSDRMSFRTSYTHPYMYMSVLIPLSINSAMVPDCLLKQLNVIP